MTERITPPDFLKDDALEAWHIIVPRVARLAKQHGEELLSVDAEMLGVLCNSYAEYRNARQQAKQTTDERERPLWEQIAEQARIHTRKFAAGFFLIADERVNLAPLNSDGDDEEILRWFKPE